MLGSATQMPFDEAQFDAVVALDVLEHIPDDVAATREIFRVLKPGGVLIVTVPAYQSLWSRHDVALHHKRRYRSRQVRNLLRGAGFTLRHLTYTVSVLFPAAWVVRRLQNAFQKNAEPKADALPTREPLNGLLLALLNAEGKLSQRVRLPFGLTVFAIARKEV
jgi:ubiquinone/menaquinone biosynthesis C-methylase UbiE